MPEHPLHVSLHPCVSTHTPVGAGPFPAETTQLTQDRRRCAQATAAAAGVCMLPQVCQDVSIYCHKNSAAGVRARQLCPLTCGCHDPLAPLALSLPGSGCGDQCMRTGAYLDALASMPCRDNNTALLQLCDNLDQVKVGVCLCWGCHGCVCVRVHADLCRWQNDAVEAI